MPKKTRKQKILAQGRRHSQYNSLSPKTESPANTSSPTLTYKLDKPPLAALREHKSIAASSYVFIYHDVKRIGALTILAIGFEAVVYWLIKHNRLLL